MFCCAVLCVHSSFAIIWMVKRKLVALLCLYSLCPVIVVWLFLMMPRDCLQFAIVEFPDHTHLLILVPSNMFKPSSNFQGDVLLLILFAVCVFCLSVILSWLFLAALLSPAWTRLTSWFYCMLFLVLLPLSHMMSWGRGGTCLYQILIFDIFLHFVFCNSFNEMIGRWLSK